MAGLLEGSGNGRGQIGQLCWLGLGGGATSCGELGFQGAAGLTRGRYDRRLRVAGDNGIPLVLAHPDSPAAQQLTGIAEGLANQSRGLVGRPLGLSPV